MVMEVRRRYYQGRIPLVRRFAQKQRNGLLDSAGPAGFEGGLTTRKYVAMSHASRATGQREIAHLVETLPHATLAQAEDLSC